MITRRLWSVDVSLLVCLTTVVVGLGGVAAAQRGGPARPEPFTGITANGTLEAGLFSIKSTGVSTAPVREAAQRFLQSLTDEQRGRTSYPVDDTEWLKWNNVHRYTRQGVSFKEMTDVQGERGLAMMQAGLSARGFEKSRNIMRLNGYLAELLNNFNEYGEGLYYLTVMGGPSRTEPWGWQLDGHHLVINYFVLGDQVVMTPTFMGSEPVTATTSKYGSIAVLHEEQNKGLAFMQSLSAAQQAKAAIQVSKTANNALAQAFRDNIVLDYAGLPGSDLSPSQQTRLLGVVEEFVGNMADGHAKVRMDEVRSAINRTFFAWIGGADDDSAFYFRIHSPIILIEFDHQTPVALPGARVPGKAHVHTVVRTPNGNDYGKDLLRQHYAARQGDPQHWHR